MNQVKVERLKETNYRDCVCFNLRRTARLMTQLYDTKFQTIGLRSTQVPILVSLLHGPQTLKSLAHQLNLEHSTLVRSIRRLADAGWVHLEPGTDRRTRIAKLTEAGLDIIQELDPLWNSIQTQIVDKIGEEKFHELQDHLQVIRHILYDTIQEL